MREMHMAQKPRISLDPEKVILITAVLGLLDKVADIVIKAVSYDRRYPQLLIQVRSSGEAGVCPVQRWPTHWQ